jgi:hypothetical protein
MNNIRFDEEGSSTGDSFEADVNREGRLVIEIEQPWSGSTECGFGQSCAFTMTKDQARQLAAFLLQYAA